MLSGLSNGMELMYVLNIIELLMCLLKLRQKQVQYENITLYPHLPEKLP